jgi:hypothetical protein
VCIAIATAGRIYVSENVRLAVVEMRVSLSSGIGLSIVVVDNVAVEDS